MSSLAALLLSALPANEHDRLRLSPAGRRAIKEASHSMGRERPGTTVILFLLWGLTNNSRFIKSNLMSLRFMLLENYFDGHNINVECGHAVIAENTNLSGWRLMHQDHEPFSRCMMNT